MVISNEKILNINVKEAEQIASQYVSLTPTYQSWIDTQGRFLKADGAHYNLLEEIFWQLSNRGKYQEYTSNNGDLDYDDLAQYIFDSFLEIGWVQAGLNVNFIGISKQPTRQQYYAIEEYLEYAIGKTNYIAIGINHNGYQNVEYDLKEVTPSYISNRIKRCFTSGRLYEMNNKDKSIYNKKKTGRKTRQKGFGWYGSLNPNAGNVEKNIEIFNDAQPDGFTATNPVNGNTMGESFNYQMNGMVEDDFFTFERDNITYHFFFTPGRRTEEKYAILAVDYGIRFDKEPYKNEKGATVIPMSRVHDKPQQKGYFEFTSESHPELVDAMEEEDRKKYRDLVVAEMAKHMELKEEVEDLSWLDNLHDILSSILNGQNKDKELEQRLKDAYYKNYPWDTEEWGPFDPEDTSWLEDTSDAIREYDGMDQFWTDMKDALYKDDLNESKNNIDWSGLKNYLKGYLKDKYLKWNISDIGEDAPDYGIGEDNCPEFFQILDNTKFGGVEKINKLINFIDNQSNKLEETSTLKRYIYTGPIYHLGNKIAERSRMITTAVSFKQAVNNLRYRIANGDIVSHYDIVDEFLKEVEAPEIVSTIEEKPEVIKCDNCGIELNPMGECPVCDYGEDDLVESIYIDSNLDALSQLNRMEGIV